MLTCCLSILCAAPWRRQGPCPYWVRRAAHSPILALTWQLPTAGGVLGGVTTARSVPRLRQVMADVCRRWARPDALCQPGAPWSGVDGSFLSYLHIAGLHSSGRIPSRRRLHIPPRSIPLSTVQPVLPRQSQWSRGAKKAEGLERMSLVHPLLWALAWARGASGTRA